MNDLTSGAPEAAPPGRATTTPTGSTAEGAFTPPAGGSASTGAPSSPSPRWPPGPAPLRSTVAILSFGHLAWLGWVWLVTTVVVVAVATGVGTFGELEQSIWVGGGAAWQRFVLFAAGVTTITSFARILMTNGVTRARLAESAVVTMVVLALSVAGVTVVGLLAERVVFALNDAPHVLDGGEAVGAGTIAAVALQQVLSVAVAYVSGWLVAIGFNRHDLLAALALIPFSVIPMLAVEALMVGRPLSMIAVSDWSVPLLVAAPAAAAVIALAVVVAGHRTGEIVPRSC